MKINSLYFKNVHLGWEIKEIKFQNLNLLVGLSGAGKSQIINTLWFLRGLAVSGHKVDYVEWILTFSIGEKNFEWKGSFKPDDFEPTYKIHTESIVSSTGETIERKKGLIHINIPNFQESYQTTTKETTPDGLLFQIYSNYDFIKEIVHHFKMMNLRDHTQSQANVSTDFYRLRFPYDGRRTRAYADIEGLRNSSLNIAERLVIAYKKRNDGLRIYSTIIGKMQSIFPMIAEWSIEEQRSPNDEWNIAYKIKVNGRAGFITHRNIASGMLRTFNIIADIYLSTPETVFLLDEFENSLGHNCLQDLEELIIDHSLNSQFILTSHHPDIINTIPKQDWIIIEREGSTIYNKIASNLGFSTSGHEPYLILTNHFDN